MMHRVHADLRDDGRHSGGGSCSDTDARLLEAPANHLGSMEWPGLYLAENSNA